MRDNSIRPKALLVLAALTLPMSASLSAQEPAGPNPNIIVNAPVIKGPDVKGTIAARNDDKIKVVAADGTSTIVAITDATQVKPSGGLFGGGKNPLGARALTNGLPVTIKTWQTDAGLVANQITYKNGDLKFANMIRTGTDQRFDEQTAATEALRGRMGDIDKYNIKATTNVYFDTGKSQLSPSAKADLCTAATAADGVNNALLLVVGYTDSVGDDDYNQVLSEKRANSVINYLQQQCHWKPYRMLTPTGMAKADPLASNDTEEGKAQNRRVAVNVLVSKGLDGM
ncbi:OmpA family protein [Novosphingobium flavum]|uniref:OmpA family protein n=1 Tax=Novosphingobium flavum TaxID=1778672 RepID=A0A7X1FPJ9_9SPHN|nr:OmpA family protein [Novosphingobium flavum]MBC2664012.1 OmpA family protein [Novosphingobium flavum]